MVEPCIMLLPNSIGIELDIDIAVVAIVPANHQNQHDLFETDERAAICFCASEMTTNLLVFFQQALLNLYVF